jgi:hypothetical protein
MAFRLMPEPYENLNSMLWDYCERSAAWVFEIGTDKKNADRIPAALTASAEKGLTKGLIHPVLPFALVIFCHVTGDGRSLLRMRPSSKKDPSTRV